MPRKRKRSRSRSGGSVSRRSVLLLLGVGGIGAGSVYGSSAFDVVEGRRPFDVASVEDGNAFLEIEISDGIGSGDDITLLTLTNRFDSPLNDVDVSVDSPSSGSVDASDVEAPTQLDPDESGEVAASLSCSSDADGDVEVSITATGPDESVELTRSVPVDCRTVGGGTDPCAHRSPAGCEVNSIPTKGGSSGNGNGNRGGGGGNGSASTDCSVVIDTGSEVDEKLTNADIGGALDIDTEDELALTLTGNATVSGYLRLEASSEIEFTARGNPTVGGPVQFDTSDEVTATIQTPVGGGLCVKRSGSVDLGLQSANAAVRGPVSITSTGEVDISGNGGGAEIDGGLTIATDGEVSIPGGDDDGGNLDLTVNGNVDIDTDSEVTIGGDGDGNTEVDISGDVDIDTENGVTISLSGSTIDGDVTIRSQSEVDVALADGTTVTGSLTIDTSDEVEVSNCDAVEGTVNPSSVCSGDDDGD